MLTSSAELIMLFVCFDLICDHCEHSQHCLSVNCASKRCDRFVIPSSASSDRFLFLIAGTSPTDLLTERPRWHCIRYSILGCIGWGKYLQVALHRRPEVARLLRWYCQRPTMYMKNQARQTRWLLKQHLGLSHSLGYWPMPGKGIYLVQDCYESTMSVLHRQHRHCGDSWPRSSSSWVLSPSASATPLAWAIFASFSWAFFALTSSSCCLIKADISALDSSSEKSWIPRLPSSCRIVPNSTPRKISLTPRSLMLGLYRSGI